ncbi:MAG: hypothetical protein V1695_02090 [Candidatus Uhrbacteria bacterium]
MDRLSKMFFFIVRIVGLLMFGVFLLVYFVDWFGTSEELKTRAFSLALISFVAFDAMGFLLVSLDQVLPIYRSPRIHWLSWIKVVGFFLALALLALACEIGSLDNGLGKSVLWASLGIYLTTDLLVIGLVTSIRSSTRAEREAGFVN